MTKPLSEGEGVWVRPDEALGAPTPGKARQHGGRAGNRLPSAELSGLDFRAEGGVPSTPSHSCPVGSAHPGLQLAQLPGPTLAAPGEVPAWEESCEVCAEVPPPSTPSGSPFETGLWQMYHLDGFHRAGGCDGGPHKTEDRTRPRGREIGDIEGGLGGVLVLAGAPRAADRGRLAWDRVPSTPLGTGPAGLSVSGFRPPGWERMEVRCGSLCVCQWPWEALSIPFKLTPWGPPLPPGCSGPGLCQGPGNTATPSPEVSKDAGPWKRPPHFQTGLPPGQPPSDFPFPSSSPVLNGILDNQSVRPSAQLGKCSSVEGDVTDGARLPPVSGEAAPPPSAPSSRSSLFIIMGTGVPRAERLGRGSSTWLEDGFRPFLLLGQLHRWGWTDACQPPGRRLHLVSRRHRSGRRWDPAGHLPVQEVSPPH